ncbi:uncharacterized protein CELE_T22C1.9 [Caenorhabditis elegans]|uniref:Uncharacterized protein n=1 Tax=Caenorhabditis elegans TaxID=6239 RepID=Q22669_CAEEL|nr:Uncharacterized protein CELE_T22C1.9 [Caenorhabditis elegans]CAA99925.2 Uncharacterized protein CELE_T22C1.9 [Caenorhabditis elegans]|eukprot:NP_492195.2 Uncharacterized protein CELE_T22C1.9 [Caenorhabditis elegans]
MVKPANTSSSLITKRVLTLGNNVTIDIYDHHYYPMWFWIVISVGFVFCTLSCAVWFMCAMWRLKKGKECNHPSFEARTVVTKDGEEKPDPKMAQKSEKTCKKLGALGEAESLAKSFKSIRSKKSMKSTKSKKSEKDVGHDDHKKEDVHGDQKDDNKDRNDGGRDSHVVQMEHNSEEEHEPSGFKKLGKSFFNFKK